jgi:RING finger protein 113A
MFRKPKRKLKESIRRKDENDLVGTALARGQDGESDEEETEELQREIARNKREKSGVGTRNASIKSTEKSPNDPVMHSYEANASSLLNAARDLVTSTAEHHPTTAPGGDKEHLITREDGIYRGDQVRNKFHAGPIRAAAHVRVTARFDYQPDICKDYKETGFCGYGDTCIYLHDRGDTISGWQLEQQWEEQQKLKKEKQDREMHNFALGNREGNGKSDDDAVIVDDGLPFACHLCREHFKEPVVTNCLHYFCESCIMNHVRTVSEACPICGKDTGSVFNLPSKLISKKRKVLGLEATNESDSWVQYFDSFRGKA